MIRHGDQERHEYEPPTIIDYGDWGELTRHDPLSSPSHPGLDHHQLGSSITPHH